MSGLRHPLFCLCWCERHVLPMLPETPCKTCGLGLGRWWFMCTFLHLDCKVCGAVPEAHSRWPMAWHLLLFKGTWGDNFFLVLWFQSNFNFLPDFGDGPELVFHFQGQTWRLNFMEESQRQGSWQQSGEGSIFSCIHLFAESLRPVFSTARLKNLLGTLN